MILEFTGELWYWRGPAPHYFVPVPPAESDEIKAVAAMVTYGWGVIPVRVEIGGTSWTTSLFPKDGRYLVPVRKDVRTAEHLEEGEPIAVRLHLELGR
jgi:nucleoid-associated protein YgaU